MVELPHLDMYLGLGRPLFPCSERDKSPLTTHGFKDASLDPVTVRAYHARYPRCVWGTPCSPDYAVIDIDPRNGGDRTWAALIREHGDLPPTPTVDTGSDGIHYVTVAPPGTRKRVVGPGVELLAIGSYVILAPSRVYQPHHSKPYAWRPGRRLWELDPTPTPAWVLATDRGPTPKAISVSPRSPAGDRVTPVSAAGSPWVVQAELDLRTHPGAAAAAAGGEGRRPTLLRLVGGHVARGDDPDAIWAWAEAWAARCTPPLDDWAKHAAGVIGKEARQHHHAVALPAPPVPAPEETISEETNPPAPTGDGEFISSGGVSSGAAPQPAAPTGELVSSAGVSSEPETDAGIGDGGDECCSAEPQPLVLHPDAYHGPLGDMLRAVEVETEAHPAGILVSWHTLFGNVVGRGAWVAVGARSHYPVLNVGVGGRTSDAKGDSFSVSLYPFRRAEPVWAATCIANGIGSGEGLIERVADALVTTDGRGNPVVIPGAADKRLVVRLSELSRCFKVGRRENATLSEYLREAWDGEPIHVPNRKGNALAATGYTVSVVGDITPAVLGRLMANGTEAVDGFANRFLWVAVRSPRSLPSGGNVAVLDPFIDRLKAVLDKAKQAGEVRRDADAERLWAEMYPALKASGDTVPHTDRARPHVVRLSLLYALADGERVIREPHLRAALAVWDFCRRSASLLFAPPGGGTPSAEPDPLWLQALSLIQSRPGVGRGEVVYALRHAAKAEAVGHALDALHRQGLAHPVTVKPDGGGRPGERWYPGPPDGNGDGDKDMVNNVTPPSPSPAPVSASGSWVVRSEETRPEEMNSAVPVAVTELVSSAKVSSAAPAVAQYPELDADLVAELEALYRDEMDANPAPEPAPEPVPTGPPYPTWATGPTPPDGVGLPSFAHNAPVPPGWLDGQDDAEKLAAIWPVPDGWGRSHHAHQFTDRGCRVLYNPTWPVRALARWDGEEDTFIGMVDGDPALAVMVPPQPAGS